MKGYFTSFSHGMERLSNNEHAQKIFWIVLCTCCSLGLALLPMLLNYRRLWVFNCPTLTMRTDAPAPLPHSVPQRAAI